jgi:single-strand DNA-binding protein
MNNFCSTGRASADAEIKYTEKGTAVCQFNYAVQSGYGENRKTSWYQCTVWGEKAEKVQPMIRKGSFLAVTGELTMREYAGKDGVKRISPECRVVDVTLLDKRGDGDNLKPASEPKKADGFQPDPFADEDIPFN